MKLFANYLLLAFLVGYLDAVKFRCDYSYSKVGWFKYHTIPATWREARLRCRYEGGMLASPTNVLIKGAMLNAIGDVDIFTGIHATLSSGNFRTLDGLPLDSIPHIWAENEPDNKNNAERCTAMNSEGHLSDVSCDKPRPYICHRPLSVEEASDQCGTPDSEYRFEKQTKKCYKFHTTPRTFADADFICAAEGGHLAIINNDKESIVMRNIFTRYSDKTIISTERTDVAFIGFHNLDGEWTTIHDQTLKNAGFDKFFLGEPNNGTTGEYCGSVFRNGFLNDLWCDKRFAFICEKQTDFPHVCDSDDLVQSTNGPEVVKF